jgi:hypothetical protein
MYSVHRYTLTLNYLHWQTAKTMKIYYKPIQIKKLLEIL